MYLFVSLCRTMPFWHDTHSIILCCYAKYLWLWKYVETPFCHDAHDTLSAEMTYFHCACKAYSFLHVWYKYAVFYGHWCSMFSFSNFFLLFEVLPLYPEFFHYMIKIHMWFWAFAFCWSPCGREERSLIALLLAL